VSEDKDSDGERITKFGNLRLYDQVAEWLQQSARAAEINSGVLLTGNFY